MVKWPWPAVWQSRGGGGSGGAGDDPAAVCGRLQAEVDHPAKVESGHPQLQPLVILADSAVAELAAAVLWADQPGDGPLDHGPVPPVGVPQVLSGCPVPAGLAQQGIVGRQVHPAGSAGPSRSGTSPRTTPPGTPHRGAGPRTRTRRLIQQGPRPMTGSVRHAGLWAVCTVMTVVPR